MQYLTSPQYPAIIYPPSHQPMNNITPRKEMFAPSTPVCLVVANTTPPHALESNNNFAINMQPVQPIKRRIDFTDSQPPVKKIAISRNYSYEQPCLPVRRNIFLQTPMTCDASTQTDSRPDMSPRVKRRIGKSAKRNRRLNPNKILDEQSLKELKERRNSVEKDRVRQLTTAFNVLKNRLPPTRIDDETSRPIFPKTHFEILRGAIAYMKSLNELLSE